MTENVTVAISDDKREITLQVDGKKAGEMGILISKGIMTVYHTEVADIYEGRGFAKLLLDKLVGYARVNNLKIIPLCPYVHAQFRRYPSDFADVWSKTII